MGKWYPDMALDEQSWLLKLRPGLSQIDKPLRSWHMEPSCTEHQEVKARIPGDNVFSSDLTQFIPSRMRLPEAQTEWDRVAQPLLTLYVCVFILPAMLIIINY